MLSESLLSFFGPGLSGLSLSERSTIANMALSMEQLVDYFVDQETIKYMKLTRKNNHKLNTIETFVKNKKFGTTRILIKLIIIKKLR